MKHEDRTKENTQNCSIGRSLQILGEKWTLLILREAFLGAYRFEEFHRVLGCARNLLTERLQTLTEEGILIRVPYKEPGSRVRDAYQLTDKGHEILPVLAALMQWGDRHLADEAGPAAVLCSAVDGAQVRLAFIDEKGRTDIGLDEVVPAAGLGCLY
ncbi:helix-turn-helix domain-containing protein [Streptomyces sp. 150FB]|uniref:winged helix-turn-helix transcriptional regulator n=1 Tax=Streptomyces sp. 150FB TaxID=1576605 RepID=UPI00099C08C0|nr:helix-turn-helix domain-containing protein [Streptomyces sp. 150FB]